MADKVVQVPGVGNVAFPDTMSDDDISATITQQIQQASQPNAGLAPPAGPDTTMQTSGAGSFYRGAANTARFVKGYGSEALKQTFGGGSLGSGGQLPQAQDNDKPQSIIQSMSDAASQSSLGNVLPNIGSGISNTGKAIAQGVSTPEGAGAAAADITSMIAGGKGIAAETLPSKARAGELFNQASQAAGGSAIDLTAPGNTALAIRQAASSGGRMPKVVKDFISRATDPSQGPITYDEARTFYQNAGALSVNERNGLSPSMQRMLGQFRSDLGNSIQGAASGAGVGTQYAGAMQQYRQASAMENFIDMLKSATVQGGKKMLEGAAWGSGAAGPGYAIYKAITGQGNK